MSRKPKEEYHRFFTVSDPRTHEKGHTEYKVTARVGLTLYLSVAVIQTHAVIMLDKSLLISFTHGLTTWFVNSLNHLNCLVTNN